MKADSWKASTKPDRGHGHKVLDAVYQKSEHEYVVSSSSCTEQYFLGKKRAKRKNNHCYNTYLNQFCGFYSLKPKGFHYWSEENTQISIIDTRVIGGYLQLPLDSDYKMHILAYLHTICSLSAHHRASISLYKK